MTRKNAKRNTVIIILCCVLILSVISISISKNKHPLDETLDKLWDKISKLKDILEGVERLAKEIETDIEEVEEKIKKVKMKKDRWLEGRNRIKKSIQPLEQQESAAINRRDKAADDHNEAIVNRENLLKEGDEILLKMKNTFVSPSSETLQSLEKLTEEAKKNYDGYVPMCGNSYYCTESCPYCNEYQRRYEIWQRYSEQLDLKKSELRLNQITRDVKALEATIKAEKKKYSQAVTEIRKLSDWTKLGSVQNQEGPRWLIWKYSMQIKYCNDDIKKLEDKIEKLEAEKEKAEERERNLNSDIKKQEDEWKKLNEEAQEDPEPKI